MENSDENDLISMEIQDRISEALKCIHLIFEKSLNKKTSEMNMTGGQLKVLIYLSSCSGKEVNPVDIERRFELSRPTVTGILKRLQGKGFIAFKPSQKDRRYKQIILTDEGKKLICSGFENLQSINKNLCSGFEKAELESIYGVLLKMLENLKESEENIC
ncbi:MAG: MarR family winged helix-turn-helix transcriptional regulator [Clostridiales bacterium]|nr:MarR family winged helix-turn-helix transcriptional regulator [Clostridiales bacterium]